MSAAPKTNLAGLTKERIESFFVGLGAKAFHGRNVLKWIHKHGITDFAAMTDVPKALRDTLDTCATIELPHIALAQPARDGTTKWVLQLADGQHIETVHIPDGDRHTICVSSQVGCALNCSFCSTAQQGFNRNLDVAEIIGQVWLATREIGRTPTNVVMMGMGEPFHNYRETMKFIRILNDKHGLEFGARRITVSTSGMVPGIQKLAEEPYQVNLAISLHAPNDKLRSRLVPINDRFPIEVLMQTARDYIARTGRRISFEYALMKGINDSDEELDGIVALLSGKYAVMNLIPFNAGEGLPFRRPGSERARTMARHLHQRGILTKLRQSAGQDVDGGCGQLRARGTGGRGFL